MGIQVQLSISGAVQGVSLRWMMQQQAHKLQLTGYAKNMPDGTVAAEIQGPRASVEQFINWLQSSPGASRVTNVVTDEQSIVRRFEGFQIL